MKTSKLFEELMAAKKANKAKKRGKSLAKPARRKAKPISRAKATAKRTNAPRSKAASKRARTASRGKTATTAAAKKPKPAPPRKPKSGAKPRALGRVSRPPPPLGPSELDTIKIAYLFRAPASAVYGALMDPAQHAAFTGDEAEIEATVGGRFSAFHGFVHGTTVELVPDARIVQKWRTHHFPKRHPDSTLELTLTPVEGGTRLEMRHIGVPKEQAETLADGWLTFYWEPLSRHLTARL